MKTFKLTFMPLFLALLLSTAINNLARSQEIRVILPYTTPPYFFNDGTGIVFSLTKEALAYNGYTIKPFVVNVKRGFKLFEANLADAYAVVLESSGLNGFYSEEFMQYHNTVIALKKHNYRINKLGDLEEFYTIGFQHAHKYLGSEFEEMTRKAKSKYSELGTQKQQTNLLFKGGTDVVVIDKYVFSYFRGELASEGSIDQNIETEVFDLIPPIGFKMAFHDKKIRDDFDDGIRHLKETGRYDEIYESFDDFFKIK